MDSKLKAKVITIALLMVVMVIGTVFYANYLKDKAIREKKAQKEESQVQTGSEEIPAEPIEEYASLAEKYHLDPSKDPYAFLGDDSFFDVEEEEKDPKTQLSLLVSSAERDIYVSVVNGEGEAVKGQRFGVSLTKAENTEENEESTAAGSVAGAAGAKNTGSIENHHKKPEKMATDSEARDGVKESPNPEDKADAVKTDSEEEKAREENIRSTAGAAGRENRSEDGKNPFDPSRKYVDLDKDGCIYIADIDAGQYKVSLEDVEGFEIAGNDVPVQVKEQLEYTVLKDISYLIRTEDEIDAAKEDTQVNQAEIDADGTEHHQKLSEEDALLGIDVSKWNKEINWQLVKEDGIRFAIIRCGYRGSSTGALVEDKYFKQNIEGATQAGLKVGVYFFTQAVNEVEAVEEASMVLSLIRPYKLEYPLYIDTEGAGGHGRADGIDKQTRTNVVKAFCETIENSGFNAGIYANRHWFRGNLDMSQLTGYQNWLAQYSDKPTYDGEYSMWQYTSAGSVSGINGRVDLNLSYMAY
ncbi:MAG: hypothetical protein E7294_03425 [Lachnospiraceae bacterium]|jgi:GH25 family lysozyme M1 (1,4-beta-N-acetylmuramidase)|nr:hypothetical protein [Lachnospiraceae bacterium]